MNQCSVPLPQIGVGAGVTAQAVRFIRQHAGTRRPLPRLSAAACAQLETYPWPPDNYAALEACIQRTLVLYHGDVIEPRHLALETDAAQAAERRAAAEILRSLRAAHGERRAAAARLGIAPRTLRLKCAALRASGVPVPASARPVAALHYE